MANWWQNLLNKNMRTRYLEFAKDIDTAKWKNGEGKYEGFIRLAEQTKRKRKQRQQQHRWQESVNQPALTNRPDQTEPTDD